MRIESLWIFAQQAGPQLTAQSALLVVLLIFGGRGKISGIMSGFGLHKPPLELRKPPDPSHDERCGCLDA